ncbi:vesicle-associated membrane protein 5-like [Acipenser oxyrinchus oxyrinchus]|uniref:Vesicle-associated membrane protein 5-like n=1 Tax=Acipenser oxyrinchus oxyrinchus TaxID=40147 RepID=A0AAD8G7I1_ACIOX|nr:vesicle-associated membrane protein 5-like [Acipenser oxyrinchus oxyrinchus]
MCGVLYLSQSQDETSLQMCKELTDNIGLMVEKLEELKLRSEDLQEQCKIFVELKPKVSQQTRWKNIKTKVLIGVVVIVLVIIAVIIWLSVK